MSKSKHKLKIGQSLETRSKSVDPNEERRRENQQFLIWTLVVPAVMLLVIVVLWLLRVWG
ncbi:MAG: hypothetical protein IT461_06770 [Planctomycetes bacterium]|nr:hypothetical protein [Planctomycetota bacterium]